MILQDRLTKEEFEAIQFNVVQNENGTVNECNFEDVVAFVKGFDQRLNFSRCEISKQNNLEIEIEIETQWGIAFIHGTDWILKDSNGLLIPKTNKEIIERFVIKS